MGERKTHDEFRLLVCVLDLRGRPAHLAPRPVRHEFALHCRPKLRRVCTARSLSLLRLDSLNVGARSTRFTLGKEREEFVRRSMQRHPVAEEVGAEEEEIVVLFVCGVERNEGRLRGRNDEVSETLVRKRAGAVQVGRNLS